MSMCLRIKHRILRLFRVVMLANVSTKRSAEQRSPLPPPDTFDVRKEGTASSRQLPTTARDVLLEDKRWLKLAEECADLFDELDIHSATFDDASRELADHVCSRLQEILERSGVELISGDLVFDRHRHQPERAASVAASGTTIAETLSPGFVVGRRVLRRARVRLIEPGTSQEAMT